MEGSVKLSVFVVICGLNFEDLDIKEQTSYLDCSAYSWDIDPPSQRNQELTFLFSAETVCINTHPHLGKNTKTFASLAKSKKDARGKQYRKGIGECSSSGWAESLGTTGAGLAEKCVETVDIANIDSLVICLFVYLTACPSAWLLEFSMTRGVTTYTIWWLFVMSCKVGRLEFGD